MRYYFYDISYNKKNLKINKIISFHLDNNKIFSMVFEKTKICLYIGTYQNCNGRKKKQFYIGGGGALLKHGIIVHSIPEFICNTIK